MSAKPASNLSHKCTGHGPYPPRLPAQASPDVFINGIAAIRNGDLWNAHCAGSCHPGTNAAGSSTVFINNKNSQRMGDPVDCGSYIAQGSPNVFIGG